MVEPSHVILALGYGEDRAHSAIRIGVGRGNTDAEIDAEVATIGAAVRRVQKLSAPRSASSMLEYS